MSELNVERVCKQETSGLKAGDEGNECMYRMWLTECKRRAREMQTCQRSVSKLRVVYRKGARRVQTLEEKLHERDEQVQSRGERSVSEERKNRTKEQNKSRKSEVRVQQGRGNERVSGERGRKGRGESKREASKLGASEV